MGMPIPQHHNLDNAASARAVSPSRTIAVSGVGHTYNRVDGAVLEDINLTLDEGSVVALIGRSGSGKSTLYKHFPSKDHLVGAVLEREGAAWRHWFFSRMGAFEGPAQQKVGAVFDVLEEWFEDPHFYGCPFINAIAEGSQNEEIVSTHVQHHKAEMFSWLRALALEIGHSEPDTCARSMVVLIDGAIVAAQTSHDTSFAQVAKTIAMTGLVGTSRA